MDKGFSQYFSELTGMSFSRFIRLYPDQVPWAYGLWKRYNAGHLLVLMQEQVETEETVDAEDLGDDSENVGEGSETREHQKETA